MRDADREEMLSQPSWAAWIEIAGGGTSGNGSNVAALMGCVD